MHKGVLLGLWEDEREMCVSMVLWPFDGGKSIMMSDHWVRTVD